MLWFSVWFVLVAGSLVGGAFLLRHVYRSARALVGALDDLSATLDRLDSRVAELADTGTMPTPVELADPEPARARVREARRVRAARLTRRAERHETAYRRWWAYVR